MEQPGPIPRARVWAIAALAGAGVVLSAYLAAVSLSASGRPPGCGPGSGCEAVLASRWGGIGTVPMGALAGAAYAALLACLAAARRPRTAQRAWTVAAVLSVGIIAAAVWFTALQVAVVGAVCLYCLADHALGVGAALLVLATVFLRARPLAPAGLVIGAGFATILALIALQFLIPHHSTLRPAEMTAEQAP